ncbi:MAG: molybdopterin molybdotransferase MoeA [Arenicellales bacterium WSBS_2016_MAG_OTU3]
MTSPEQLPADCFDPNSGLIPVHIALEHILQSLHALSETEHIATNSANGRVLAADVLSPMNVPPHANSAMDGYAVRSEDLSTDAAKQFQQIGTAFAGKPFTGHVGENQTVRIMTGAALPKGTNTVIMQERVHTKDDRVFIPAGERPKQNTRNAGEDIKTGDLVIAAGAVLYAPALGVLASIGIEKVSVTRRVKVAVLSTGDELRDAGDELRDAGDELRDAGDELRTAGEKLNAGQIFDSNRPALKALLENLGCEVLDKGIVRDQREATDKVLLEAAAEADVIISSGGASTGAADYISEAVRELGGLGVWRIALRPGRPFGYGRVNNTHFFGLPGNPVAVMTTFYALVQPSLRKLMGQSKIDPTPKVKAKLKAHLRKKPGRVEYYRAYLSLDDGQPVVELIGGQGSGMLHSMHLANCFIVMAHDDSDAKAGELVSVHPFHGAF